MKNLLSLTLITFVFITACKNNAQDKQATADETPTTPTEKAAAPGNQALLDSSNWTTVVWIDSAQNFGKVTDGEKVNVTFRFKNAGSKPLVIQSVQPACGCTVAERPEKPVLPGEEGVIKAAFNSQGRLGMNHKTLTVVANTPQGRTILAFEGEVLPKK